MLGYDPFPDIEELVMMVSALDAQTDDLAELGTRIPKSGIATEEQRIIESAEVIENIVKRAGGIGRIVRVFRQYRRKNEKGWRVLVDWYKLLSSRRSHRERQIAWKLTGKYHQHPSTLWRWRMDLIARIARDVVFKRRRIAHSIPPKLD
jgi:hypothetical protein